MTSDRSDPSSEAPPLRIGTRGSDLALWQAHAVEESLQCESEVVVIKTEGDRRQDIALQGGSTTGFFTKEIEARLLDGEVDIAVHSLKDLPTEVASGLDLGAILPRHIMTDLLVVHPDWLDESALLPLREGCVVGAGSLRRQALVRLYGSKGVTPELIRGNVPTRLGKCDGEQYGAVVLARAGVERLGLDLGDRLAFELNPVAWLPAPGQGAVAVEIRQGDSATRQAVAAVNDDSTAQAVNLERSLLAAFEGGCHTAFGALAVHEGGMWVVDIGMDRGDAGWGQARFAGSYHDLAAIGPDALGKFTPLTVDEPEALRRPWQPESSLPGE